MRANPIRHTAGTVLAFAAPEDLRATFGVDIAARPGRHYENVGRTMTA